MRLSFHGADRTVTGSCHLIECAGRRILVDCGLLQGGRELDEENVAPFGFDPAAIDLVLLTHAHLDHCGRLPLLAKRGFRGEIVATAATRELTRVVLLDAAHLQEEDARRRTRSAQRRGGEAGGPLYSIVDALDVLGLFGRTAEYDSAIEIAPGIRATFLDAGHIAGSASILLELDEAGRRRRLLFSGDLGNAGRWLLRPPAAPPPAEIVLLESTYGDRLHRPFAASVDEFYGAIAETRARRGNVIIPTFALERGQELLFAIREGIETSRLPPDLQVFLDSPMAIAATEIFRRHPDCYKPEVAAMIRAGRDPFGFPGLHLAHETSESMALNRLTGGAVILAGSGMCTGGRVRHHLKHNLWRHDSAIVLVGFAATGTLARQLIDGAKTVRLFGEEIAVRARIWTINGFSAHADQRELLDWHGAIAGRETTYLVHGEESAMTALAARMEGERVVLPRLHEAVEL